LSRFGALLPLHLSLEPSIDQVDPEEDPAPQFDVRQPLPHEVLDGPLAHLEVSHQVGLRHVGRAHGRILPQKIGLDIQIIWPTMNNNEQR